MLPVWFSTVLQRNAEVAVLAVVAWYSGAGHLNILKSDNDVDDSSPPLIIFRRISFSLVIDNNIS